MKGNILKDEGSGRKKGERILKKGEETEKEKRGKRKEEGGK